MVLYWFFESCHVVIFGVQLGLDVVICYGSLVFFHVRTLWLICHIIIQSITRFERTFVLLRIVRVGRVKIWILIIRRSWLLRSKSFTLACSLHRILFLVLAYFSLRFDWVIAVLANSTKVIHLNLNIVQKASSIILFSHLLMFG